MRKKLLFCISLLIVSLGLMAQTAKWTDTGNYDITWYTANTSATKYEIATPAQLAGLAVLVNGLNGNSRVTFSGKTITLTSDIDLDSKLWTPIGTGSFYSFQGTFTGNNKTINNMAINITSTSNIYAGLFAYNPTNGIIQNIHLNGSVTTSTTSGTYVGGLVGENKGQLLSSSFEGSIDIKSEQSAYIGGVTGWNYEGTTINCSFVGDITSQFDGSWGYSGGITGENGGGTIQNCYARANILATGTATRIEVGGITGYFWSSNNIQQNCYFEGSLNATGTNTVNIGGLVGGYSGGSNPNIQNNYWKATGTTKAFGGTPPSGTNIKNNTTFTADNGGTLSSLVSVNGKSYADLLEALNAWVEATQMTRTYNEWESGAANDGYPVLVDQDPLEYWIDVPDFSWYKAKDKVLSVATPEELAAVAAIINGYRLPSGFTSNSLKGKTIILADDIDLSGKLWTPIGTESVSFNEVFDGKGFTITGMVVEQVKAASNGYAGLFSYNGSNGTIQNVHTEGKTSIISYTSYSGGLVGYNKGKILNCSSDGDICSVFSGTSYAGGIVGYNDGGIILNSYNESSLYTIDGTDNYSGGITGRNDGVIQNGYNTGIISATGGSSKNYAGGIAGHNNNSNALIQNSYNIGELTATGGSAGKGGICGYHSSGNIENGYWLTATATAASGYGTSGLRFNSDFSANAGSTLQTAITIAGTPYTDLLKVLNAWVSASEMGNSYSKWKTDSSENDGYPIHTTTEFTTEYWIDYAVFDWYNESSKVLSIATPEALAGVAAIVNNYKLPSGISQSNLSDKIIFLANDIDLDGKLWVPIANVSSGFKGILDGENYTISNMLIEMINATSGGGNVGLFGYNDGIIRRVNVAGTVNSISYSSYSAGIAGYNNGKILSCSFDGNVYSVFSGTSYSGGIAGCNNGGDIFNCYNKAALATTSGTNNYTGGIAGENKGKVENCYNRGALTASDGTTRNSVGGITGYNNSSAATIRNCYNIGTLTASGTGQNKGGVCGYHSSGKIENAYFLASTASALTGYGTSNLKDNTTFTNTDGGTLDISITINSSSYTNLLAVLNAWRNAQTSIDYVAWEVKTAENDGYPILTLPAETPFIITQPQDASYAQGESLSFAVSISAPTDGGALSYQWQLSSDNGTTWVNASAGSGATNKTYTSPALQISNNGNKVRCIITNTLENANATLIYSDAATMQLKAWTDADIYDISWYSAGASSYTISSAEALGGLSVLVNGMHSKSAVNFSGKTITLTNDIDLDGKLWTPIGNTSSSSRNFQGVFDGQGKKIANMLVDINSSDYVYAGLFGYNRGTVSNVNVTGDITVTTSNSVHVGGVAGYNTGTLQNVSYSGSIKTTSSSSRSYIGGIVGYNTGIIRHAAHTGTINATCSDYLYPGGISGYNTGIIQNSSHIGNINGTATSAGAESYFGGISGYNSNTIQNNYVRGTLNVIASSWKTELGGIIGYSSYSSEKIENNYFEGTLSVAATVSDKYIAGIAGSNSSSSAIIQNNYWLDSAGTTNIIGTGTTTGTNIKNNAAFTGTGTFAADITAGDYKGKDMLAALNAWRSAQTTPADYSLWETRSQINDGYPIFALKTIVWQGNGSDTTDDTKHNWSVAANWVAGVVPTQNDIISFDPDAIALHIDRNVTVAGVQNETEENIVVLKNASLNITEDLIEMDNARFVLKSGMEDGKNAAFVVKKGVTVAADVEFHTKANADYTSSEPDLMSKVNWQYFGTPVDKAPAMTFPGAYVRYFNNSAGGNIFWHNITANDNLNAFTGYEIATLKGRKQDFVFSGTLQTNDKEITLTNYTTDDNRNFPGQHVLANAYTAGLNIRKGLVFGDDLDGTVYLYHTGSEGDYLTDSDDDTAPGQYLAVPQAQAGANGLPSSISSMQGFVVRFETPGTGTDKLTFKYEGTGKNTEAMRVQAKEEKSSTKISLVSNGKLKDCAWLFVDENATRGYDNKLDGRKIISSGKLASLYTREQGQNYQVNAIPDIHNSIIAFKPEEGIVEYTLNFTHENMSDIYTNIYLLDLEAGIQTDISENGSSYSFTSTGNNVSARERFKIITHEGDSQLTSDDYFDSYQNGGKLYVINKYNQEGVFKLYNLSGQQIVEKAAVANGQLEINQPEVGVYLLQGIYPDTKSAKKIVVR